MISKIYIKNFRSIKEISLEPSKLSALIGPNSTGKTNILKAIDIILGETYPTERAFSKDDFFDRKSDETIVIKIDFVNSIGEFKLASKSMRNQKISTNVVSLKLTHTKNETISFGSTSFTAFGKDGNEYYANSDVREAFSFIYIPSERNLDKQVSVSQWSILGKILRKIDENFRKNEGLTREFIESMKSPKSILESPTKNLIDFYKFKTDFIEICKEGSSGLANNFDLDLNIYDPLFFYKTIQVIAVEEFGTFNLEELGSGMQNLILLALFRTYAKTMKGNVILAIEEPEIYLYPQAQRALYKSFISLSEQTQIFYTTHNPNFVDASRADDIFLLRKNIEKGTYKLEKKSYFSTSNGNKDKEKYKIYTHFNPERNELFFAKKVLFVEGDSDKILFSTLCEKQWNIDLDKNGISIISCNGKGGVNYFLGVCNLIGFEDYFAIWDKDPKDESYKPEKDFLSQAISNKKGIEIDPNLEGLIGTVNGSGKIENAHKWALKIDKANISPGFKIVEDFLRNDKSEENGEFSKVSENDLTYQNLMPTNA